MASKRHRWVDRLNRREKMRKSQSQMYNALAAISFRHPSLQGWDSAFSMAKWPSSVTMVLQVKIRIRIIGNSSVSSWESQRQVTVYGHLQQVHLQRPSLYELPPNLSHFKQNHLQLLFSHLQLYHLKQVTYSGLLAAKWVTSLEMVAASDRFKLFCCKCPIFATNLLFCCKWTAASDLL